MRTRLADTAARRHAEAAPGEMRLLAEEITRIAAQAQVATPVWSALFLAGEPMRVALSAGGYCNAVPTCPIDPWYRSGVPLSTN